jgi:hypothetical protein
MSKHTPGPWKYSYRGFSDDFCIRIQTGNSKLIAFIEGGGRKNHERMEANARLIAAAPELLDQLCGCIVALHTLGGFDLSEMRKLLAKIEGIEI